MSRWHRTVWSSMSERTAGGIEMKQSGLRLRPHYMRSAFKGLMPAAGAAASVLLAASLLASMPGTAEAFRHRSLWIRSWKASTKARIELANSMGEVVVTGRAGDSITVVAEVRIKAPGRSSAETIRGGVSFDTSFDGSLLRIQAKLPRVRMAGLSGESATSVSVRYLVLVPLDADIMIDTLSGGITVTGVRGKFDLASGGGTVELSSPYGEGRLSARDGDVRAVLGSFAPASLLEIDAAGDVELVLPADVDAEIDAGTSFGRVRLGIAIGDRVVSSRRSARGTFGEGTGSVRVSSSGGDVSIGTSGTACAGRGPAAADRRKETR